MKRIQKLFIALLLFCSAFFLFAGTARAENGAASSTTEEGNGNAKEEGNTPEDGDDPPAGQGDPTNDMKNGWQEEDDGRCYYVDDVRQTGWLALDDGTYFLAEDGRAVKDRWILEEEDWYYLNSDYRMAADKWQRDSRAWCYLQEDGRAAREKWIWWGDAWYYLDADCRMLENAWQRDSVGWCYLLENGKAAANRWVYWSGGWYYLKGNCRMAELEWVRDSVGWCYLGEGGKAYANGWRWIGKTDYKFSASARMVGAWMDVPCIMQNPELPTGCESVALTNALNYYGFDLAKTTMASKYIARSRSDFVTSFLGNPYSYTDGGMVCAPGIVIAADKFLEENESELRGHELTGSSLWSLCQSHVANGRPVIIWTSIGYSTSGYKYREQTYQGRKYFAHTMSHTVVLNGFDEEAGVVWISDSLSGKIKKSYSLVNSVYKLHGSQAVILY